MGRFKTQRNFHFNYIYIYILKIVLYDSPTCTFDTEKFAFKKKKKKGQVYWNALDFFLLLWKPTYEGAILDYSKKLCNSHVKINEIWQLRLFCPHFKISPIKIKSLIMKFIPFYKYLWIFSDFSLLKYMDKKINFVAKIILKIFHWNIRNIFYLNIAQFFFINSFLKLRWKKFQRNIQNIP